MPTRRHWLRRGGALDADIEMFFMSRGHLSIDYRGPICGCGKPGSIEVFAAGRAIAKRAQAERAADHTRRSTILKCGNGSVDIASEMVGKSHAADHALAKEVSHET